MVISYNTNSSNTRNNSNSKSINSEYIAIVACFWKACVLVDFAESWLWSSCRS